MRWDELLTKTIRVGATELSVDALLRCCVDDAALDAPRGLDPEELRRLRERFVHAGLAAVQGPGSAGSWFQLGLEPSHGPARTQIYARLATLAGALLDDGRIEEFFFMHKDPGLRVRFGLGGSGRSRSIGRIRAELEAGVAAGEIAAISPGIYEPETQLFGGPRSMEHVHRLFTHDSLMWLRFHALAGSDPALAGLSWSLSLLALKALFAGLRIMDWEDIDVWDRVRSRTGRRILPEVISQVELEPVAHGIQEAWLDPTRLMAELPDSVEALARAALRAITDEAARWREHYFGSEEACIGPRAGAALFVIFHWNRAGLSSTRQALFAESLCRRTTV